MFNLFQNCMPAFSIFTYHNYLIFIHKKVAWIEIPKHPKKSPLNITQACSSMNPKMWLFTQSNVVSVGLWVVVSFCENSVGLHLSGSPFCTPVGTPDTLSESGSMKSRSRRTLPYVPPEEPAPLPTQAKKAQERMRCVSLSITPSSYWTLPYLLFHSAFAAYLTVFFHRRKNIMLLWFLNSFSFFCPFIFFPSFIYSVCLYF
jgi:hypothetical protein